MWDQLLDQPLLAGVVAAAVVVLILVAVAIWLRRRRRRRDGLQRRFGAEYQRTVDERGSRREAERDLVSRREQRESLTVHPVDPADREAFRGRFEQIQSSFVDAPEAAVRSADGLILEVAALRGYDEAEGMSRLEMVSVDHPEDTAVHRRAMMRLDTNERLDTEQLRQILLGSRRLFERLLRDGEDAQPDAPAPPRTLLGLGEEDEDDVDRSDEVRRGRTGADRDEPGTGEAREPGSGKLRDEGPTLGTRPDEHGRVAGTVDLTGSERSSEPGAR